jgi:hypothetical protein
VQSVLGWVDERVNHTKDWLALPLARSNLGLPVSWGNTTLSLLETGISLDCVLPENFSRNSKLFFLSNFSRNYFREIRENRLKVIFVF